MNIEKLAEVRGTILSRLELIDELVKVPSGFSKKYKLGYTDQELETSIMLSAKHGLSYVADDIYEDQHKELKYIPTHQRRMALQHTIQLIKDLELWIKDQIELSEHTIIDADEYIKSLKKGN